MGCGGSKNVEATKTKSSPKPTAADMEQAKILYVELKCDWKSNPEMKSLDDMKNMLGVGGATKMWGDLEGLRHKYFTYCEKTDTVYGVYVFYNEGARAKYMESDLFGSHKTFPHFSSVKATPIDVMPGTELSVEKVDWKNYSCEEIVKGKVLVVDITMNYKSGVEGLPTNSEQLHGFMAAPPKGQGYPAQFGKLDGLRGKYFGYNPETDHCYGFYTFVNTESLEKYMSSDLFTKQGEPPHIEKLEYWVHDILPGTERVLDLGNWGSK
jgi:hypothetical protein